MQSIIIITSDSGYFFSHRLSLAQALQKNYQVTVLTQIQSPTHHQRLKTLGFEVIDLNRRSKGIDPLTDIKLCTFIRSIIKGKLPDFIIAISMRMIFLTLIASRLQLKKSPPCLGIMTGLGFLASSRKRHIRLLKQAVMTLLKKLLAREKNTLVVQNQDDYHLMATLMDVKRLHLIPGSGINIQTFCPKVREPKRPVVVTMVSRLLKDKGVKELIEAAALLPRYLENKVLFQLVGEVHLDNPNSYQKDEIKRLLLGSPVRYLGKCCDIATIYQHSDIAVLPSYREGLPRSLLEAAACGLPLVTTDVPGCREVCRHGENGLLVPVRNPKALVKAIEKLVHNPHLREKMGRFSRQRAEREFSEQVVNQQMIEWIQTVEV